MLILLLVRLLLIDRLLVLLLIRLLLIYRLLILLLIRLLVLLLLIWLLLIHRLLLLRLIVRLRLLYRLIRLRVLLKPLHRSRWIQRIRLLFKGILIQRAFLLAGITEFVMIFHDNTSLTFYTHGCICV